METRTMACELDLLAALIWAEARGEPLEGQVAVACVVRNRVKRQQRLTYLHAMLQAWEFSCFNPITTEDPWVGSRSILHMLGKPSKQHHWVAQGVYLDVLDDNTSGATLYYNPELAAPAWATACEETAVIGCHRFMRGPEPRTAWIAT